MIVYSDLLGCWQSNSSSCIIFIDRISVTAHCTINSSVKLTPCCPHCISHVSPIWICDHFYAIGSIDEISPDIILKSYPTTTMRRRDKWSILVTRCPTLHCSRTNPVKITSFTLKKIRVSTNNTTKSWSFLLSKQNEIVLELRLESNWSFGTHNLLPDKQMIFCRLSSPVRTGLILGTSVFLERRFRGYGLQWSSPKHSLYRV